jgi:hypothetical protein
MSELRLFFRIYASGVDVESIVLATKTLTFFSDVRDMVLDKEVIGDARFKIGGEGGADIATPIKFSASAELAWPPF